MKDGNAASRIDGLRQGCFESAATPLCAVCLGDGPYPDASVALGAHCIVSPALESYYLVTQPEVWAAAPGWYVSDTLVGFPHVGVGTPTSEQSAVCDAMKGIVPTTPPPDGGDLFPPANPAPCK